MITVKEIQEKFKYLKSERFTYLAKESEAIDFHTIVCFNCKYNNVGCSYYEFAPDDIRLIDIIKSEECQAKEEIKK